MLFPFSEIKKPGHILPALAAFITQKPREYQDIEWSDSSWTHNVFRLYEMIFWRRYGVRTEVTALWENGQTTYRFHTFEAALAHVEGLIRGLAPRTLPVRIYIPVLATPLGNFPASPFLFAVAYDNSGIQSTAGSGPSFSLAVSGANRQLIIVSDNGTADAGTSATYNAVSATFVTKQTSVNFSYLYQLQAPATGTNTVQANGSNGDMRVIAANYTGASQSGSLDASTTQANASTASFVPAITTTVNNCMIVVGGQNNGGSATASVGTMRQAAATGRMLGDNTAPTAGSNSMTMGGVGTAAWGAVVASIAPASTGALTRTLMGVGQ